MGDRMVKDEKYIKAVDDTLNGNFYEVYYSVAGYGEDAICLQKDISGRWVTYIGFRHQRKETEDYDNIVDACLGLIRRLSEDYGGDYGTLSNNFFARINKFQNTMS